MKRILSLLVLVAVLATMLVSCGETTYKLGIGTETTNSETAKTNVIVAGVVLDADGKIVVCRLDSIDVQVSAKTDLSGIDTEKTYSSKMELGDDYGMLGNPWGSDLAEWDDQAKVFEQFVVGKTASEVEAITGSEDALVAGCTLQNDVALFKSAIAKACKDQFAVTFKSKEVPTLGVALNGAVADESGLVDGAIAIKAELTVDAAAVAMVGGKIVAATLDCSAPSYTLSVSTSGVSATASFEGSKRELGDDYGMLNSPWGGSTLAEWYVQAQAFADTAVGKTADEVSALVTEGLASCTIYAGGFKAALEKAADYVR